MSRVLLNLTVALLAFILGVASCFFCVTRTTLEEISKNPAFYDGEYVQVESYASFDPEDGDEATWEFGEQFEKSEVFTFLTIKGNSNKINDLREQLTVGRSEEHYRRAMVRVNGIVHDNCLSLTCCFGPTMTIDVQSLTQIDPVETYTIPVQFRRFSHIRE